MNRSRSFFVQELRFLCRAAARTESQHSNGPAESALWHGDGVADPEQVVGLSLDFSVDCNRS